MKIFKNRQSAGKLLAEKLEKYKDRNNTIVLAIPRGGVVVGAEVAKDLKLPLDIIITRKIGAPHQKELSLGALDPDGEVWWQYELLDELGLSKKDLEREIEFQKEEILRRERTYRQDCPPLNVTGKTILLIDDGIATGATIISAVKYLRRHKAQKIVLAAPLASKESVQVLEPLVEKVKILHIPVPFQSVGQFYESFLPVSDQEVIQLLIDG